jgi:hypothetical protein
VEAHFNVAQEAARAALYPGLVRPDNSAVLGEGQAFTEEGMLAALASSFDTMPDVSIRTSLRPCQNSGSLGSPNGSRRYSGCSNYFLELEPLYGIEP